MQIPVVLQVRNRMHELLQSALFVSREWIEVLQINVTRHDLAVVQRYPSGYLDLATRHLSFLLSAQACCP